MDSQLEAFMRAYLEQAGGDHERALREAVSDTIADLLEAERRTSRAERLISKSYVRGRLTASLPLQEDRHAQAG
jgi:DNA gyrase/topoisomerase IV subunit B